MRSFASRGLMCDEPVARGNTSSQSRPACSSPCQCILPRCVLFTASPAWGASPPCSSLHGSRTSDMSSNYIRDRVSASCAEVVKCNAVKPDNHAEIPQKCRTRRAGDCVDDGEAFGPARERLRDEDRELRWRQGAVHDQIVQLRHRTALLLNVGLRGHESPSDVPVVGLP